MPALTEEQVERRVERMTDHLDRLLMTGAIDQKTYDSNMRDLSIWADRQFAEAEIWDRARRRSQ